MFSYLKPPPSSVPPNVIYALLPADGLAASLGDGKILDDCPVDQTRRGEAGGKFRHYALS